MTFTVRLPGGAVQSFYSPSLVVHDHLQVGERLSVADFRRRATTALEEAGERVRARFGFLCTSAAESAAAVAAATRGLSDDAAVEVVALDPPLPAEPALTGSASPSKETR